MTIENELKDMKNDIRKTYGAYSSLQSQMHNIFGDVQEIEGLLKSLLSVFNDLKTHFSEAMESRIKIEDKKGDEPL